MFLILQKYEKLSLEVLHFDILWGVASARPSVNDSVREETDPRLPKVYYIELQTMRRRYASTRVTDVTRLSYSTVHNDKRQVLAEG